MALSVSCSLGSKVQVLDIDRSGKSGHGNCRILWQQPGKPISAIKKVVFGIKQPDRFFHGKSTVLAQMMRSDLVNGVGFALLDAHGDLAEQVLGMVPEERIKDVVYINPALTEFSPAINLLGTNQSHLGISQFISVFKHLWPEFWGPRTEYLLRHSLLLLAATFPGASLADVPRVLKDFAFRQTLINHLPAGDLRDIWDYEFSQYTKSFRKEAVAPILNKIGAVVFNPRLRPIFCRRKNDINFRQIMDTGQILIANLSKGSVGEDASSLLGSLILARLILAGLSRSDILEQERRFFAIYADEAQQFLTESSLSLFSELRKYAMAGTWSTQYVESLPENVRQAILGNAGSLIVFPLSGEDAKVLTPEFAPVFPAQDLINLPVHQFYLKLKMDGVTSQPFSAETLTMERKSSSSQIRKLKRFTAEAVAEIPRQPKTVTDGYRQFLF